MTYFIIGPVPRTCAKNNNEDNVDSTHFVFLPVLCHVDNFEIAKWPIKAEQELQKTCFGIGKIELLQQSINFMLTLSIRTPILLSSEQNELPSCLASPYCSISAAMFPRFCYVSWNAKVRLKFRNLTNKLFLSIFRSVDWIKNIRELLTSLIDSLFLKSKFKCFNLTLGNSSQSDITRIKRSKFKISVFLSLKIIYWR